MIGAAVRQRSAYMGGLCVSACRSTHAWVLPVRQIVSQPQKCPPTAPQPLCTLSCLVQRLPAQFDLIHPVHVYDALNRAHYQWRCLTRAVSEHGCAQDLVGMCVTLAGGSWQVPLTGIGHIFLTTVPGEDV